MKHEQTPEYQKTERPFLQQLSGMGWHVEKGDVNVASETGRDSFEEVILVDRLRSALRRINDDEDGAWMDEHRIEQAVTKLERTQGLGRMATNKEITRLLQEGIPVDAPEGHWGDTKKAKVVDLDDPDANEFVAVNQFRVDRPGTTRYVVPDIVLFVNGLPLVVVECKSPYADKAIEAALRDLFVYSNQKDIEEPRGSKRLFDFNLAMVGTCFEQARMGALGAPASEFVPWKDTSPVSASEVADNLGKQGEPLSQQETLVAGMLRPAHLIDLLANFVVYEEEGSITKIVGRYQQFRTVHKAMTRLKEGETKAEHGLEDQRGGIVWHTQGAGKSLTMVFLVRKMRRDEELRSFKVVGVTDRTSLEDQLTGTAELAGEPVRIAESTAELKSLLSEEGSDLVFAMIQKFQDPETGEIEMDETFDELNDSEEVTVLVDEAHRTHTNKLHQNLRFALPNAARIGFTGTPIIDEAKKLTTEIFGEYVDKYKMEDAEEDGVILPIRYEGKTTMGDVGMPSLLDAKFEDVFADRSDEEMRKIQEKYATRGEVLEAEKLIEKKAHNMLRHYVETVLPGKCKAQVVATSRKAAVRYQEKLVEAKEQLLDDLESLPPAAEQMTEDDLDDADRETQFLVRASEHMDTIRRLDFAAVISEGDDDPDSWRQWTNDSNQRTHKSRFKKDLVADNDANQDGLCMLVVHGMLTTGFDAPVNQAMYLDRRLKGHNLLQAIARVNRRYPGKSHGLVVDYCGVASHLADALHEYNQEDVKEAMVDLEEELPKLDERHRHVVDFFEREGISIENEEACVELLRDEKKRAQFSTRLRKFLRSYDTIMPRPEAAEYRSDVKRFGRINRRAANRYYDDELNILDAGPKVRRLIDEHVEAEGIETTIEPTTITEPEFDYLVGREPSDRAKAARMEHAVRHHVRENYNEDPVFYEDLSERVQNILEEHQDDWERQRELFEELIVDIRERTEEEDDYTGNGRPIAPFARILANAVAPGDDTLSDEERDLVTDLTVDVVDHVAQEIDRPDFWRTDHLRNQLRSWVIRRLDDADVLPYDEIKSAADDIIKTAEANHEKLTQ
jgi:type I restriction enzyme R subunit